MRLRGTKAAMRQWRTEVEELKWKDQGEEEQVRTYQVPPKAQPISVRVGIEGGEVAVIFGAQKITMPAGGARDLALALRQAANKIERRR